MFRHRMPRRNRYPVAAGPVANPCLCPSDRSPHTVLARFPNFPKGPRHLVLPTTLQIECDDLGVGKAQRQHLLIGEPK